MDLKSFREVVDRCPEGIASCQNDLRKLYLFVGLSVESGAFSRHAVSQELYRKIAATFVSGHKAVFQRCRELRRELICGHVLDNESLHPYFSILDNIEDAVRNIGQPLEEIKGDWCKAIRYAYDNVKLNDWSASDQRERVYTRTYEVARAAKRLREGGYPIIRNGDRISLARDADDRLIAAVEELVAGIGGINVARRIFRQITPLYDPRSERYHLVKMPDRMGAGVPQIPFGYLFQLAAKYFDGRSRVGNSDANWDRLVRLATDYAAMIDVQVYNPYNWGYMDAKSLLPYLHEIAVYDTMFRIPQIRGNDVAKIIRGVLPEIDFDKKHGQGWTINEALLVVSAVLDLSFSFRGPVCFRARDIMRRCQGLNETVVTMILNEVLSHRTGEINQRFSRPSDAPIRSIPGMEHTGHDFFRRPLIRGSDDMFFVLDRSACAPAFVEALFTPLRTVHTNFDGAVVGPGIEQFLRAQFAYRGVETVAGQYIADRRTRECDIVVETAKTVLFLEIKKKPLTRIARAGSNAHVLLDLAESLLAAQVQAGWHEIYLRRNDYLELNNKGVLRRVELKGREVERIAVSFQDFGSFQDRVFLEQFLQGTMGAQFSVTEHDLQDDFNDVNCALSDIARQVGILEPSDGTTHRPFFHCWFLSLPQLMVLLDDVNDNESFRSALWKTRHIMTGSSDFYHDYAYMRKLMATVAVPGSGAS
jgi:hypothetical protein